MTTNVYDPSMRERQLFADAGRLTSRWAARILQRLASGDYALAPTLLLCAAVAERRWELQAVRT